MIDKKTRLTALALAIGFSLLLLANTVGMVSRGSAGGLRAIIRWELIYFGTGFFVSLVLFRVYAVIETRLRTRALVTWAAVSCFCGGVLWESIAATVIWHFAKNPDIKMDFATLFVRGGVGNGTVLGFVSFLYFGIEHRRLAAEQAERAQQATALAHQAQLQMLRYQLNPHFLFNALNSIRGMIMEDPVRSREMVVQLADFLRYSLSGKAEESTIADEMEAIENYLAIQRIRFEDKLDVTVQADESALRVGAPCFLIHPLVENAVKYGMKTSPMPLRIRISVRREDEEVTIQVANTGKLATHESKDEQATHSTGIGLKNVSERLQLIFPGKHAFRIWESDSWVRAEIRFQANTLEKAYETAHGGHSR